MRGLVLNVTAPPSSTMTVHGCMYLLIWFIRHFIKDIVYNIYRQISYISQWCHHDWSPRFQRKPSIWPAAFGRPILGTSICISPSCFLHAPFFNLAEGVFCPASRLENTTLRSTHYGAPLGSHSRKKTMAHKLPPCEKRVIQRWGGV